MNKYTKFVFFFLGIALLIFFIGLGRSSRVFPLFSIGLGPGVYDFQKSLTGDYMLYRNSSEDIFIAPDGGWNEEIAIIQSKVIKVNIYGEFIIAEHQELDKKKSNTISDKIDYCILNTDKNYVLKHLNNNEFRRKLDSLKIPIDIELIDIYKY